MATNAADSYFDVLKNSIAREMFRDTADQNYTLARFCFFNKLNTDFYWLALHSIEKYTKCSLLINGYSSKGFGHDIEKLSASFNDFAGEFVLKKFENEFSEDMEIWFKETPGDFIKRINNLGHPENRYNSYGFSQLPTDVQKLDQLVFSIRSVCFPLKYVFPQASVKYGGTSYAELLIQNKANWKISFDQTSPLAKIKAGKLGETLRLALLDNNFLFSDDDYDHPPFPYSTSSHNPVLLRYINWPLKNPTLENVELAQKLYEWVDSNIQISKGLAEEIQGWFDEKEP